MHRKAAKELLHIKDWLDRVAEIVAGDRSASFANDLLHHARDATSTQCTCVCVCRVTRLLVLCVSRESRARLPQPHGALVGRR